MDNKDFVVVPFNMLPSEEAKGSTPEKVEKEKQAIRDLILHKNNWEVSQNPKAMKLLGALGSDLIVNAFACNFRLPDGTLNDDVEEANNLNRRIVNRLSISSPNKLPAEVPFFLTSTEFLQHEYGDCATNFKKRLGLKGDTNLFVLRNVTMSPFPTEKNFIAKLAKIFEDVAKEEVAVCRHNCNTLSLATFHNYILIELSIAGNVSRSMRQTIPSLCRALTNFILCISLYSTKRTTTNNSSSLPKFQTRL